MLQAISDLPDGVLGFEATGEIQADYRDVLMPAVREVWERGDEVRIVLVFERWDGMSSGAAWEDLKVGMKNLTKWKRIALVTDLDWMITVTSLFGWMTPGELKRFPVAERGQAITWAAGLLRSVQRVAVAAAMKLQAVANGVGRYRSTRAVPEPLPAERISVASHRRARGVP